LNRPDPLQFTRTVRPHAFPPRLLAYAAALISSRRAQLKDALTQLGNPAGEPERHRMIRLRLTPWCEVHVDAVALERLDEGTTDLLGQALTHALREERLRNKGGRT
jgi:hypothetical protein